MNQLRKPHAPAVLINSWAFHITFEIHNVFRFLINRVHLEKISVKQFKSPENILPKRNAEDDLFLILMEPFYLNPLEVSRWEHTACKIQYLGCGLFASYFVYARAPHIPRHPYHRSDGINRDDIVFFQRNQLRVSFDKEIIKVDFYLLDLAFLSAL